METVPIVKNSRPPKSAFLYAITVMRIKMKLGIKCIKSAKYHIGSFNVSRAKMLIKTIRVIDKTWGAICMTFFSESFSPKGFILELYSREIYKKTYTKQESM